MNDSQLKPTLLFILISGIFLRLFAAIAHIDLIFPDEHFQTLEPASRIVFGYGWKSWEWYYGIRSWFVPGLYMPVLFLLKMFGITSGSVPIIACQLLNALVSGLMLWQFERLLSDQKFHPLSQFVSLLALAISPAMIVWGVSTFSDTWAMCSLWIFLPYVLRSLQTNDARRWFYSGALLGVTFVIRLQMITWFAGLVLALIIFAPKEHRRFIGVMILGYFVPIFFQGILDYITWGHFLYSSYKSVQMNIFEGVANLNGVSPWSFYILGLLKNLGPFLYILFLLSAILSCLKKKMDFKTKILLISSGVYFAAHLAIGHKEFRFILPIVPVIFYILGYGINDLVIKFSHYFPGRKYLYLITFFLALSSSYFVYLPTHYSQSDLSYLSLAIQKDGRLKKDGGCLLFVDHYWIWGRGEMLQGHPVNFVEVKGSEISKQNLESCTYAMMPSWSEATFINATGNSWEKFKTDAWGNSAYRKLSPSR